MPRRLLLGLACLAACEGFNPTDVRNNIGINLARPAAEAPRRPRRNVGPPRKAALQAYGGSPDASGMQDAAEAMGGPVPFPGGRAEEAPTRMGPYDKAGYLAAENRDWQIKTNQLIAQEAAVSSERDSLRRKVENLTHVLESQQAQAQIQKDTAWQLRQTTATLARTEAENTKLRETLKDEKEETNQIKSAANRVLMHLRGQATNVSTLHATIERLSNEKEQLRERLQHVGAGSANFP